jgi:membrane associated rhomboid family serine protease
VFPLHDENPTVRQPIATVFLILLNASAWVFLQGVGSELKLAKSLCEFGLIPGDLFGLTPPGTTIPVTETLGCVLGEGVPIYTPVTAMFMHGSWFHIIGNMWFLWVFGDNVEDAMGPIRFLFFYLLCGLGAAAAQIATEPDSVIPMVGASGAIGGVMGAYVLLYPRAHVHTLIILGFYITTIAVPAFAMLGYWFLLQLLGGLPALGSTTGGVAFWAHIGGFLSGLGLVIPFRRRDYLAAHQAQMSRRMARHRW